MIPASARAVVEFEIAVREAEYVAVLVPDRPTGPVARAVLVLITRSLVFEPENILGAVADWSGPRAARGAEPKPSTALIQTASIYVRNSPSELGCDIDRAIDDLTVPAQNIIAMTRAGDMGYRTSGMGVRRPGLDL